MLHRGGHDEHGRRAITDRIVVAGPQQQAEELAKGYFVRQEDAIAAIEKSDLEIAQAAAEENARIRRMTATAQREANAKIDDAGEHLAEIPAEPIKRKSGRPKKVLAPVEG